MDADLLQEAEEFLRELWQQQGCSWPGLQIQRPEPDRICALCRRRLGIVELTGQYETLCQRCYSGS